MDRDKLKEVLAMSGENPSSVHCSLSSGNLYRMINFPVRHGSCGGSLVQFQEGQDSENALPFTIGKVLVSSDMNSDDVRGNHAHYETEEIVVALSGGCTFELDNGRGRKETVSLSASDLRSPTSDKAALLLYPHIWRTFFDFEPGTVLLIVANIKYDEADYIRDRSEFESVAASWKTLGGSAEDGGLKSED